MRVSVLSLSLCLFVSVILLSSCRKYETCTYTGYDFNGDYVSYTYQKEYKADWKRINREECQYNAESLTEGNCECVEE